MSTCIAWSVSTFRATPVPIPAIAARYPPLRKCLFSAAHLWSVLGRGLQATYVSWCGPTPSTPLQERLKWFNRFLQFLQLYRGHAGISPRLIVGGCYYHEKTSISFCHLPQFRLHLYRLHPEPQLVCRYHHYH